MFGDVRPDCIVVCIPDALGDLRVQNPELSAKERKALEILKREEENLQGDLFAPTEEELAEAEALRTTAEDLLFRSFYRALKAKVHKYENAVPIQVLRRGTIDRTGRHRAQPSHASVEFRDGALLQVRRAALAAGGSAGRGLLHRGVVPSPQEAGRSSRLCERGAGVFVGSRTVLPEGRPHRPRPAAETGSPI